MNKKQRKEYEGFIKRQMRILQEHFDRCMLRCMNKMHELENKKGCGKMYCAIEDCGEIDNSHTAHCVKHGRGVHRICGEDNSLCNKCKEKE